MGIFLEGGGGYGEMSEGGYPTRAGIIEGATALRGSFRHRVSSRRRNRTRFSRKGPFDQRKLHSRSWRNHSGTVTISGEIRLLHNSRGKKEYFRTFSSRRM